MKVQQPQPIRITNKNLAPWSSISWDPRADGRTSAALFIEVFNLLNSDDLRIFTADTTRFLGLNSVRDFGRRWQLSLSMSF